MRLTLSVLALASTLGLAGGASAASSDFLTGPQKQIVLRAIDNVCGDTWCEGDYNFRFQQIYCSARAQSCRVVFKMFPHGEERRAIGYACDLTRVRSFAQLVTRMGSGYSFAQAPYEQMTACIEKKEASFGVKKRKAPKRRTRR